MRRPQSTTRPVLAQNQERSEGPTVQLAVCGGCSRPLAALGVLGQTVSDFTTGANPNRLARSGEITVRYHDSYKPEPIGTVWGDHSPMSRLVQTRTDWPRTPSVARGRRTTHGLSRLQSARRTTHGLLRLQSARGTTHGLSRLQSARRTTHGLLRLQSARRTTHGSCSYSRPLAALGVLGQSLCDFTPRGDAHR